jgi:hypothetical protein
MNRLRAPRRLLFVGFGILLLGGWCGPAVYSWHHRLKAMRTAGNLRSLWVLCESSAAKSSADVYAACRKLGVSCAERDGWGRPYLFEIEPGRDGAPRCRVLSLGRDGRRSSCCQKDAGWCWDLDLVFDGEWRQGWNTLGSGRSVACPEG